MIAFVCDYVHATMLEACGLNICICNFKRSRIQIQQCWHFQSKSTCQRHSSNFHSSWMPRAESMQCSSQDPNNTLWQCIHYLSLPANKTAIQNCKAVSMNAMNEWFSVSMNGWFSVSMNEWFSVSMHEWIPVSMNERVCASVTCQWCASVCDRAQWKSSLNHAYFTGWPWQLFTMINSLMSMPMAYGITGCGPTA